MKPDGLAALCPQVVRGSDIGTGSWALTSWANELQRENVSLPEMAISNLVDGVRRVHRSVSGHEPCLPGEGCKMVSFTYGTLPIRPFTGGHTWFNQNVQVHARCVPLIEP